MRLFISLLLSLSFLAAQDFRATLQGVVSDPSQAAVAKASVTLRNTGTNVERSMETGDDGFYAFQFLPPGTYALTVKAAGFKTVLHEGILLNLSQVLREDIGLTLGENTQILEVRAAVSTVEADSTALGTAIRQEVRDNLPLKGRSSLFMFTLTPGVVNNRYGEDTRPNDTITNVLFSANGGPVAATDVFVDGVANTINVNRGVNISQWVPAVDSIGEFKLEVGTVPAEYGRSGGSVTNIVIKSGTNNFHGSAYEFFRNAALDANQFFSRGQGRPLAKYGSNTFGAAAGGPVWFPKLYNGKNRTFWFANYEGSKEGNAIDRTDSVPTARMRSGDFHAHAFRQQDHTRQPAGPRRTVAHGFLSGGQPGAQRRAALGAELPVFRQMAARLQYVRRQSRPPVLSALHHLLSLELWHRTACLPASVRRHCH